MDRERRGRGWGAPRYRAPKSLHGAALALALAAPVLGLIALRFA